MRPQLNGGTLGAQERDPCSAGSDARPCRLLSLSPLRQWLSLSDPETNLDLRERSSEETRAFLVERLREREPGHSLRDYRDALAAGLHATR
jgi:hypothetical protein